MGLSISSEKADGVAKAIAEAITSNQEMLQSLPVTVKASAKESVVEIILETTDGAAQEIMSQASDNKLKLMVDAIRAIPTLDATVSFGNSLDDLVDPPDTLYIELFGGSKVAVDLKASFTAKKVLLKTLK